MNEIASKISCPRCGWTVGSTPRPHPKGAEHYNSEHISIIEPEYRVTQVLGVEIVLGRASRIDADWDHSHTDAIDPDRAPIPEWDAAVKTLVPHFTHHNPDNSVCHRWPVPEFLR